MKLNLVVFAAVSLLVLTGCATSTVSTINAADRAAMDRDMLASGAASYGAMPPIEANPVPVRLDP
jgi:uncharacterized lipoprotein YajG